MLHLHSRRQGAQGSGDLSIVPEVLYHCWLTISECHAHNRSTPTCKAQAKGAGASAKFQDMASEVAIKRAGGREAEERTASSPERRACLHGPSHLCGHSKHDVASIWDLQSAIAIEALTLSVAAYSARKALHTRRIELIIDLGDAALVEHRQNALEHALLGRSRRGVRPHDRILENSALQSLLCLDLWVVCGFFRIFTRRRRQGFTDSIPQSLHIQYSSTE
mmetsp:Transcript_114566/g.334998  ORF Transcript_114566/g.334998 Transcript_114566/m.334998 type:complete len:221 (+) Transcript_114566:320-982(+)